MSAWREMCWLILAEVYHLSEVRRLLVRSPRITATPSPPPSAPCSACTQQKPAQSASSAARLLESCRDNNVVRCYRTRRTRCSTAPSLAAWCSPETVPAGALPQPGRTCLSCPSSRAASLAASDPAAPNHAAATPSNRSAPASTSLLRD